MQIGKLLYPITTLGPGIRVGIWTQGCKLNCEGCSNPELKVFDESKNISVKDLFSLINAFKYDGVTISGGEPFLQAKELAEFVELLVSANVKDILVYSGYTYEALELRNDSNIDYILRNIAALIDGPFIKNLADDTPLRGSSNQRIFVFRKEFEADYRAFVDSEKRVDIFSFGEETHFIGIPIKDYNKIYIDYVKFINKKFK